MDGPWLPNAVFFFALALPASVASCVWIALGAGLLRNAVDQPRWVRFITRRSGFAYEHAGASSSRDAPTMAVGIGVWLLFNVGAAWLLIAWPYGWLGRLIVVAYFAAQAFWLSALWRLVVRARGKRGGSSSP
jgi:hypothetical protein